MNPAQENAARENAARVLETIRGAQCSNVNYLRILFEAPHKNRIALADIGKDPQAALTLFQNVERTAKVDRIHMELHDDVIRANFYGDGGDQNDSYAVVVIEMLLQNDMFRGNADIHSNSEDVMQAIALLLGV